MNKNTNKSKVNSLLMELFSLSKKFAFTDVNLKDGSLLRTADEVLKEGSKVTLVGADGTETKVTDGDLTAEDGSTITVKSEVVEKLTPGASPEAAKAETPAAPIDETKKVEASTPEATAPATEDNSAEEVGGMDMTTLIDTIKNLIERISALEQSYSSTKMEVQKMSAEPAAKPFTNSPYKEGTVGFEIEKFNAERKKKKENQAQAFNKVVSKPAPVAVVVTKKENTTEQFSEAPKPTLDGFASGFSISA